MDAAAVDVHVAGDEKAIQLQVHRKRLAADDRAVGKPDLHVAVCRDDVAIVEKVDAIGGNVEAGRRNRVRTCRCAEEKAACQQQKNRNAHVQHHAFRSTGGALLRRLETRVRVCLAF